MANFQTHLTGSTVLGIGYGAAAYGFYGVPAPTCILAAGLCSVSGMLPDIDSGPGRPLKEITTFMAAVVPAMMVRRFEHLGMSPESVILTAAVIYALIRFGLHWLLKRYTVHRGMFHSLPTAAIFGEVAFLLAYNDDTAMRWFTAGGVVLGFLSHLLLDEIYSVQWNGTPRLKKSFGTALKLFGEGWGANLFAYAQVLVLTLAVVKDPGLMQNLHGGQVRQWIQQVAHDLPVQWPTSPATPAATNHAASEAVAATPGAAATEQTASHRRGWSR
jgi:hypothetical protein